MNTRIRDVSDALKLIHHVPALYESMRIEQALNAIETEQNIALLAAREQDDLITMRKSWSRWILIFLGSIVVFDMVLVVLIGSKVLVYEQQYLIPVFVADSLGKVVALSILVVKFLFNRESTLS